MEQEIKETSLFVSFCFCFLLDSFGTFLVCVIVEACLHVCSLVVGLREDDVNDQEQ